MNLGKKQNPDNKGALVSFLSNQVNSENKLHIKDIRSIRPFQKDKDGHSSDDDGVDIADISCMPDISIVKKKEERIYQHLLPIDNGIYDGTLDGNLLREGLGIYSLNNGEEIYSGSWKADKPNGYGYEFKGYGSTIYHGEFYDGKLKEGYGIVKLADKFEYKGTISNGNFHGLGILSIKIGDLTDMNHPPDKKETLRLVAEWKMGKTDVVFINEIQQYYLCQSDIFYKTLDLILSSYNESIHKQRQYFQILIDLLENRLNLSLLDEISAHPRLPRELRLSANLLYVLDESYTNLKNYTKIETVSTYIDRVKNVCKNGLQSYAIKLVSTEDTNNHGCISVEEIFENKLNSFTKKSKLEDLIPILSCNTFAIELIKKLVNSVNERFIQISSPDRPKFIESHKARIKSIWADYFDCLSDTNSVDGYHFYFACYGNLLKVSSENKAKSEIELIIYEAMIFCLENLKPWRVIDRNILSSYFNDKSLHEDIPITKIGDKLIIKILRDTKSKIKNDFAEIFESIIAYYENKLTNNIHPNYQNNIQEIIKMNEYFFEISETKNSSIITLQFESIKTCIQNHDNLSEYIDHFLNFNFKFCELSKKFCSMFPSETKTNFDKIASEILCSIEDLFVKILATEHIITNRTEITEKYSSPKLSLEVSLRLAASDKLITDAIVLLDMGAKINDCGLSSGKTALHLAVERKDRDMILLLLKRGANKNIVDKDGRTPNYYAKQNSIDLDSLLIETYNSNNEASVRLFGLQKLNDFLTNLLPLDFTWIVEWKNIAPSNKYLFKIDPFEKAGVKDLYRVTNIEQATSKVNKPYHHYMLETIRDLLDIIRKMNFSIRFTSAERIRTRAELIMIISQSFNYLNDQVKYSSLQQFKNEFISPFKHVTEEIESYEIFHKKLEKIELYFVYERKLREITVEQALKKFEEKNGTLPGCDLMKKHFRNYQKYFQKYFYKIIEQKSSTAIQDVIKETQEIAKFDKNTIPQIIAGLSVIFSLRISDFIEKNHANQYVLKENFDKNVFLQPHCIQILGLFLLLNMNNDKNDFPANNLAEIVTGQGKSWVLALLAAYFSLIGYQVTVSCYNEYLTKRDSEYFRQYFDPFNLNNSVRYKTFKIMCEELLRRENDKKNLRGIISDILTGKNLSPENRKENTKEKSILLIDEVDVFFSDELGTIYKPGVRIENKLLAEVQKDIWQKTVNRQNDIQESAERKLNQANSQDNFFLKLIKLDLKSMIETAANIYQDMNNKNELREKYKIEDNILKTKDVNGKFVSTSWYGYENSFYYLKLMYEKHNRFNDNGELNEENFGYLSIQCGLLSYSELPKTYNKIFGVSGSLKCLSPAEQTLLNFYNIHQRFYYPSFFGGLRIIFDESDHFLIKESKDEWAEKIVTCARRNISKNRSVLIFFYDEKQLRKFHSNYSADLGIDSFFVTQNEIYIGQNCKSIDIERLIKDEYAGHHGKVTLLTREFGRGVDFQAETIVNKNGGIHVIQTFFSENINEEIQIRGRTARKDEPGSYELILCLQHLQNPDLSGMKTPKFLTVTKDTTYKELNQQRAAFVDKICQEKVHTIQENSANHQRTLSFFRRAISECNNQNRDKFIKEIIQLQELKS